MLLNYFRKDQYILLHDPIQDTDGISIAWLPAFAQAGFGMLIAPMLQKYMQE
jgi:hypothetical protein